MHLLAVDPGKQSGLCEYRNGTVTHAELPFLATCLLIRGVLDDDPSTVVCAERFTITQQTIKLGRDHSPIEVLGVIRWFLEERGLPEAHLASPADVKRLVTDERLKALGFKAHGKGYAGHADDAARHAVYHLLKLGVIQLP